MSGLVEQMTEHITVGGFHLMHKTLLKQKIQRAINRWRLGLRFSFAQQIKQIISADSAILQTHQAQHFQALWGQAHITLRTDFSACANNSCVVVFSIGHLKVGVKNVLTLPCSRKTPRTLIVAVMLIFCFVRKVLFCLVVPLSTR